MSALTIQVTDEEGKMVRSQMLEKVSVEDMQAALDAASFTGGGYSLEKDVAALELKDVLRIAFTSPVVLADASAIEAELVVMFQGMAGAGNFLIN